MDDEIEGIEGRQQLSGIGPSEASLHCQECFVFLGSGLVLITFEQQPLRSLAPFRAALTRSFLSSIMDFVLAASSSSSKDVASSRSLVRPKVVPAVPHFESHIELRQLHHSAALR